MPRTPKAAPTQDKTAPAKPRARRPARGLRILMIASEAQPFSKTGGLADVATALPRALGRLGHEVTVVTPLYRGTHAAEAAPIEIGVEVAAHRFNTRLIEQPIGPGARVMLVDCPELYDRAGIYNELGVDYPDNPVRYAVLAAVALDWSMPQWTPDVVHAHDWQAGLALPYLRRHSVVPRPRPSSVFTIHNLAYQGVFDKTWVPRLGLTWADFTVSGFEFFDRLSFMKAGINLADAITTVSPTYALEIQRPEYGYGLDGVMRARSNALSGILNGIDPDEWNPAADPFLPAPFDRDHLEGKQASKRALLEAFGFPATADVMARPIVGMVSRMVDQKGLDLIAAVAADLPSLDATFVIVGTGEPKYQEMWMRLSRGRPDLISAYVGFDERRAHLVEAGADIFLMPSRFEPCGLNQMYSLRYGTVPVVRAVGGLVDTVKPYNPKNGQGTGFLFSDYRPVTLLQTLRAALAAFANKKMWTRLQKNGMRADFSWDRSAAEYVKMYRRLGSRHQRSR